MKKRQKKSLIKLVVEFVKLQLTGNILFWVTLAGSWTLHTYLGVKPVLNVAIASVVAHILFFLANKEWIYNSKANRKKTKQEIVRFILFMTLNYVINIGLIYLMTTYLNIDEYLAQLLAGFFFTAWNFLGFHFWVFETAKHPAITYHSVKKHQLKQANQTRNTRRRR